MSGARVLWLGLTVAVGAGAFTATAPAATRDFSSSFEASDPQPAWSNSPERKLNVIGPKRSGIAGDVTDKVVAVRASGENDGAGEVKENLVDGSAQTKWLEFGYAGDSWVELELSEAVTLHSYALTSANDAAGRDPKDWTLRGSNDGTTWSAPLDTRANESFADRFQRKVYEIAPEKRAQYRFYRFDFTANHGDNIIQLAEISLSDGSTVPPPQSPDMRSQVGAGPRGGYNAKSGRGFTGLKALEYAGEHTSEGRGYSYNKVFDVDVQVERTTELSYLIYPNFVADDLGYPSTYASVDLAFTDGTYLSELNARDQHGATVSPQGQGASKTLYTNQWNFKRSRIGDVAAGKTIDRILVAYDNPSGPHDFGGWIDDVRIDGSPASRDRARPSDWVVTTRGTNSSGSFSRGNNIPATAVPHGFNFWTPMTNAGTRSWLYEYHRDNNADNLPALEAFTVSHEPSPWMGDRQTFQVMPSAAAGAPPTGRGERALAFRHANETASPHYYGVTFENGIKTEIAPTDHTALFRFTFPGSSSSLIFDNVNDDASLTIKNGVVTGWSEVRSGLSNGATRMFVYASFDKPMKGSATTGRRTGYARFDAKTVTMRIATSLISIDQARRNLQLELTPTDTLETVRARAQRQWDDKLDVIEVEGATEDQLTTLYSNLYRLFLYPNSAHENVGTNAEPDWRHAVQSSDSDTPPASSPTHTGAKIEKGKVYVNNGFWDTYRTTWSAYSLFSANQAGELVDGFVQQYRDGGWISRWSSPGYANLMTGTSSDVSFADAYVKGVKGINARDTYNAALKNATVAPPGDDPFNPSVGRKGLFRSLFLGYTPSRVSEGVSWALEGYINDFGIANMAKAMSDDATLSGRERARLREEHEYFLSRAQNYVHMFDPAIRFFQGRSADGKWKSSPEEYDPRVWGHEHDYTETDGWNFAFHVPQDGQGLANLYGGRDKLASKLDTFFSTPETAKFPGSYGGVIHEMTEARDVRMGQWGFSNQVSHHIPYMYDYVGEPSKTQEKVREVLRRLYVGSEIGQGYAGDEDNGETSAWYLFSALGFYPLQVGSEYYAIGSPLFKQATVNLDNGRKIVVKAPSNSQRNVYVQGLKVDGESHEETYLRHADLADGATLEFAMGPEPSSWGTAKDSALRSITTGDAVPEPLRDATGPERGSAATSGGGDPAALFDDDSSTEASVAGPSPWVEYRFGAKQPIRFYTLTSGAGDTKGDPRSWVVKGSADGKTWEVLDRRDDETFRWRSQTRAFKLAGDHAHYRLEVTSTHGASSARLAEVELLNPERASISPLVVDVETTAAWAGETIPVAVKVANYGEAPASGEVALSVPSGWTSQPASAAFGPLDPGASKTLTFQVKVADTAVLGRYPIRATATSGGETVRSGGAVHVVGDTVEFTPDTEGEEPWLLPGGGSQIDGAVFDGHARFADGGSYWVYRFRLPANVTGGKLTLDIGNQFLVRASPDGQTWSADPVLQAESRETNLGNRRPYELDLNTLRGTSQTLYLRFEDKWKEDGWGPWLARLKLELTRSG
jgi:predicted alpha-1,2-mannosidase